MNEKPKENENCTFPVPDNSPYGIFAMHSFDNRPLPPDDLKKVIDGPIASIQVDLKRELAKEEDEATLPGADC